MLPGDPKCQECKHYIFTLNGCTENLFGGLFNNYNCFEKEEKQLTVID